MSKVETTKIPIEEVLSSRGRVKILSELAKAGELNISELAKRAGLNHATAKQHLKILVRSGIVIEKTFGRIRIYKFNSDDLRGRALKKLFESWE